MDSEAPTPVLLLSHGTPTMLGEASDSQVAWGELGDEARRRKVKRIVIMGAHWICGGDGVEVNMNPNAQKHPPGGVSDAKWKPYKLVTDLEGGELVMKMLRDAGIKATPNTKWDWIHDTYTILIRMFPRHVPPPTVVISSNGFYDAQFHAKIGAVLRPLRYQNTLIIASAGTVHNLYRANWWDTWIHKDNFSIVKRPDDGVMQFRQLFEDAVIKNRGPHLRRAMTRLMKHPAFREAHGTDDHFMANLFAAGAAGALEDMESENFALAENWEYTTIANIQFQLGRWS